MPEQDEVLHEGRSGEVDARPVTNIVKALHGYRDGVEPEDSPLITNWSDVVRELEAEHGPLRTIEQATDAVRKAFPNADVDKPVDFEEVSDMANFRLRLARLAAAVIDLREQSAGRVAVSIGRASRLHIPEKHKKEVWELFERISQGPTEGNLDLLKRAFDLIDSDFRPDEPASGLGDFGDDKLRGTYFDVKTMRESHMGSLLGLLAARRYRPDLSDMPLHIKLAPDYAQFEHHASTTFGTTPTTFLPSQRRAEEVLQRFMADILAVRSDQAGTLYTTTTPSADLLTREEALYDFAQNLVWTEERRTFFGPEMAFVPSLATKGSLSHGTKRDSGRTQIELTPVWLSDPKDAHGIMRYSREGYERGDSPFSAAGDVGVSTETVRAAAYSTAVHEMTHAFHMTEIVRSIGIDRDRFSERDIAEIIAERRADGSLRTWIEDLLTLERLTGLHHSAANDPTMRDSRVGTDTAKIRESQGEIRKELDDLLRLLDSQQSVSREQAVRSIKRSIGDVAFRLIQHPLALPGSDGELTDSYVDGDFSEISRYGGSSHAEAVAEALSLLEVWRVSQHSPRTARETPKWLYDFVRNAIDLDDQAMQQIFVFGDKIIDGDGRTLRMRKKMGFGRRRKSLPVHSVRYV